MSIALLLAIVALVCAIVDYIRPTNGLLNVGVACLAIALLI